MNKKKDFKMQVLLNSFETLKSDIEGNDKTIGDIIQKMFSIDMDMAIELWKHTFDKYKEFGSYLIVNSLDEQLGISKLAELIISDEVIKTQIFQYDEYVYDPLVAYFINNNDLKNANDLLELMYNNNNLYKSFGTELLTIITPYCNKITSEGVELLYSWAEKTSDTDKAKINVALLEYL